MTKKSLLTIAVLFILIFSNYYYSQKYDTLFFRLALSPSEANIMQFLAKIKTTPYFPAQLNYYTSSNEKVKTKLNSSKQKSQEEIDKYLAKYTKNPNSRDISIKLATLYFENNNIEQARKYYEIAKKIDPEISIRELN